MIDLKIISGTDRPNSYAMRVSRYLKQRYAELNDVVPEIIDLQEFPVDEVAGGAYGEDLPRIEAFNKPVLAADGLAVVCPEYNGGYPGILKLFIDYLPFPAALEKKPVCFVGEANGAFGALRAVEQLQQVFGYRNAYVFPERVFIPRVKKNFDEEEGIRDPLQQQLLESQIKNFVQYISDLKSQVERIE